MESIASSPCTFRQYLQQELANRCLRNPGYSLRAFAKSLGISHSSLSRILSAERPISREKREHLVERLGIGPELLERFETPHSRKDKAEFRPLEIDRFAVIADWYHSAILELTQTKGFQSNPRAIARRLGITVTEVHAAIERLVNVGMLKRRGNGRLVNIAGSQTSLGTVPHSSAAQRRLQKQILQMAMDALESIPVEKRSQTSMTMAINTRRLPEAMEIIRRFRRQLSQLLEQDSDRNEVYHLAVSLYPVTQPKNRSEK